MPLRCVGEHLHALTRGNRVRVSVAERVLLYIKGCLYRLCRLDGALDMKRPAKVAQDKPREEK